MSSDCSEVAGLYAEGEPGAPGAAPPGVWAFLFPVADLRLNDKTIKERSLSVHFGANRLLHVDYLLDGKPASSKSFGTDQYVCEKNGLRVSIHTRSGEHVYDKFPNRGTLKVVSVLFRVGDRLYVNTAWDTKATFYSVIPSDSYSETWASFHTR